MLQKVIQYRYLALICLTMYGLYFHLFIDRAYVDLQIKVEKKSYFKLYWAGKDDPYSERNSLYVRVWPGKEEYRFYSVDLENVERLRVDPIEYKGNCTIKKIVFKQPGYRSFALKTESDFKQLQPLNEITEYHFGKKGMSFSSGGSDPFFELRPVLEKGHFDWPKEMVRFLAICLVSGLIYFSTRHLVLNFKFVPLLVSFILMLVAVMAVISKINVHPDEYVHLGAAKYYESNWLPPAIEDPTIRNTFSGYGVSRLTSYHEVYYLIAGKLKGIISMFRLADYLQYRLINVLFLLVILLFTMKNKESRVLAVPLLISPQLWYIFSYANSEAICLLVSFLAGYQLLASDSVLNRYLRQDDGYKKLYRPIFLTLLLTVLLLLKKNFLLFTAFLFLCLVIKIIRQNDPAGPIKIIRRLSVITVCSLILVGLRFGADYYVNGANYKEKLKVTQESYAEYQYKPSTPLKDKHPMLHLKERGLTLRDVALGAHWFEKTFRSSFGVYGYHTISAPVLYYDLVRKIALALLVFFFLSLLWKEDFSGRVLALSCLLLSTALIALSLLHSWTGDFQAQGRYLLPIIPTLGLLYGMTEPRVNRKIMMPLVSIMFLVSTYSFVCVGLLQIPKVVLPH